MIVDDAFRKQYKREAWIRKLGPTPEAAFKVLSARRAANDGGGICVKGKSSNRRGPWRKGAVYRVTAKSAWRALRDVSLSPLQAPLSWQKIRKV